MGRKRKLKEEPVVSPDAAFFPRRLGKWFLIFTDGKHEWLPACRRGHCCRVEHDADLSPHCYESNRGGQEGKSSMMIWNGKEHLPRPMNERDKCRLGGKFVVIIGEQEVMDSGLDSTRQISGPWLPGTPPPRWIRMAKYQRREKLKLLNDGGATLLETDYTGKVILAVYPPGTKVPRFRYRRVMKWKLAGRTGWDQLEADKPLDGVADIPPDTAPHRIVWWTCEVERLARAPKAPPPGVRVAATVYHFCPAPGAFVRVEIVEPYTKEEWQAIHEDHRPQTFAEQLDIMREQILTFKDTPETLRDPDSALGFASWRMNPVWHYFNSAGVALEELKAAMAYDDKKEPRESVKDRIEFIARQAFALGENYTLLRLSPKIRTLRKREKMDKHAGRPEESPRLRDALRDFVKLHPGKDARTILSRLKRAAQGGSCSIFWNEDWEKFQHEVEDTPAWSESNMYKEIKHALRDDKKAQ